MRLGTCLLIGGHTPQGALHKLADFCSAPVAGFYSAVDTSHAQRLYPLSKCPAAQGAATLIRGQWQIGNSLHWSLDVVMNDDRHRARKDHAPASFAALGRIALSIIKANPAKGSNRGKFKKAGWSNEVLKTLIQDF